MFTIIILGFVILATLILSGIFASDGHHRDSLLCILIAFFSIIAIADICTTVNETRDKMRTQAVEYGYAKYEVDSKGKTEFAWIVPTPPAKVEPVKPSVEK
jgi:hypothetical protein